MPGYNNYINTNKDEIPGSPHTDITAGLADTAVTTRRRQYGYNEVKEKQMPAIALLSRKFWGLTAWMQWNVRR